MSASLGRRTLPVLDGVARTAAALTRSASGFLRGSTPQLPELKPAGKLPEWKVMCQEAKELANTGETEQALMLYHRALRMRPGAPEIKTAIRILTSKITKEITRSSKDAKLIASMKLLVYKKKMKIQQKLEMEQEKDHPRPESHTDSWQQEAPDFLVASTTTLESADSIGSASLEYARNELKRINTDFEEERYEKCRYRSSKVIEKVTEMSSGEGFYEEDKQNILANLYSCMGNACLELGYMEESLDAHLKDLRIANDYNLLSAKSRALTNVGRVHARAGRFRDAIDVWNDKMALYTSAEERAWLFHEIGRCYFRLGEYGESERQAEQSCVNSQEVNNIDLQFKASLLLAETYDKLALLDEALMEYKKALDFAIISDDVEAVRINEAIQYVNRRIALQLAASRESMQSTMPKVHLHDENRPMADRNEHSNKDLDDMYYVTMLYLMATIPDY